MRIVQVSTLYPPELFSGGTLVPHQVALGLKRRGHDVRVFAGSCVSGEPLFTEKTWEYEGIPVHAVTVTSGYAHGVANYRNASVAQRFDRYLSIVQPDVVHCHSIQALGADVLAVARQRGAAVVLTMHDGWFVCERQFMFIDPPVRRMCPRRVDAATCDCVAHFDFVARRRYLDRALENVDRVLAVSEPFARLLRDNGVADGKVVICENGLAPAAPVERTPSKVVRFGHLGGPDAAKGASTIAAAMRLLDRDLVVELRGIEPQAWKEMGGSWPDPRVRLRPRFGPAELPAILAGLDVVLIASLATESFSLVTREAMQYGLPVIASRSLGPEAIVRDGENGLLFERDDARGLAAAMARFVDDPGFLRAASAAAAATPIRTVEEQVAQIEDVYRGLTRPTAVARPEAALPRSVLFVAGMDGGPFRYRVMNLAEHLEGLGVEVTALFHHDERALAAAGEHEVVVLNRVPWDDYVRSIVERARAAGAILVFGVDDLIFDPDLHIEALRGLPRKVARDYRRGLGLFRRTLVECDAFLGSTPALNEAARRFEKPVFLVENTLCRELIDLSERARSGAAAARARRTDDLVRVGYFSGSYAHDRDFGVAAGALANVLRKDPRVRLVVGGHLRVPDVLKPYGDRIERFAYVPWRELPELIARVDVNLAPLELPSVFNEAKSALKWFEAAVCGIPSIVSPSAPFREAVRHRENGMLAATAGEWEEAISALVDDPALRARIAETAREDAIARYGPQRGAAGVKEVFSELMRLSRGALRVLPPVTGADLDRIRDGGIAIGWAATEPRHAVPGPAQLLAESVTPAISGRVTAQQPLFLPEGNLFRIDLLVGTYGRVHRYDLLLRLLDLGTGEEIVRTAVPAEHACDNTWLPFDVGEVRTREGQQLLLVLEARGGRRRDGVSVYCHHAGWPTGSGWAGRMHGANLTYRTWFRRDGEAQPEPGHRPAAEHEYLEQRLALAEERLARALREPGAMEARLRRTRLWRAVDELREAAGQPGPSLPHRTVRKALGLFSGGASAAEVDRLMETVRASAGYRAARRVYRMTRRR